MIDRFLESSLISETVSREIARNATIALIVASGAIFLYLWYAFRSVPQPFRFGAAAIIALLHDVLLVVGIFSILGKVIDTEINVMFISALLTVIGFSVHDSIVVFDRIRETVGRGDRQTFAEAVNDSLLQTLGRSLNTSLTLVFALLSLLLMGGDRLSFTPRPVLARTPPRIPPPARSGRRSGGTSATHRPRPTRRAPGRR